MLRGRFSRRQFLFAAGAAGLGGAGLWLARRPVRLGLIGAGTHGDALAKATRLTYWLGGPHGRIIAVCDVDRGHAYAVRGKHCSGADVYADYRKLLERDDVDAVLVAAPDHWHAKIAVNALKAGKAVYCEKPISLTVAEGQTLVRTVQETGGVFLGGTQQRTAWPFRTACELVRNGRLGPVRKVTVTLPEHLIGDAEGPFAPCRPPKDLDWETWLGQAPLVPYCPERCHGSFRRWYEYSGGTLTDWGAHHLDVVHWALGIEESGPLAIVGKGDLPQVENGYNTPARFTVDLDYAGGVHVHVRTDPTFDRNGIRFEGEAGSLFVNRVRLTGPAVDDLSRNPLPRDAVRLHDSPAAKEDVLAHHLAHFFACVRRGVRPISDVVSQHRSASVCHLANISLRLGRRLTWNPDKEQIVGDSEASAMLSRWQRPPYQV
jgi:myo-inositol 2-dehydrogenase / D-chiro-inositol 1-dehydrogenase